MKRSILTFVAGVCLLLTAAPVFAQAPKSQGFDDFKLVRTRNIFDPNRRATRTEAPRESRSSSSRITRANTLSLNGTMVADGQSLAFFGGSKSEYSKVIGIGDTVAERKVKAITSTQVELEHGGKTEVLAVGKYLTLEGTVEVPADSAPAPDAPPNASSTAAAEGAAPASAPSNDKNDVLRRMMERRAKEMNK